MKIISILLISFFILNADNSIIQNNNLTSCYSVQLISKINSPQNMQSLKNSQYPRDCKIIPSHNYLTIRCGCYDNTKKIHNYFKYLKSSYKDAFLIKTPKKSYENAQKIIPKSTKKQSLYKQEECYTVQLISKKNTLQNQIFPKLCKIMNINHFSVVRCGCYDNKEDANIYFLQLKNKYKHAYVRKTYKYRFSRDIIQKSQKINPILQVEKQSKKIAPILHKEKSATSKEKKSSYQKANELFKKGEYEKAINTLQSSNKMDANSYLIWAKSAEALGKKQEATKAYQQIINIISKDLEDE